MIRDKEHQCGGWSDLSSHIEVQAIVTSCAAIQALYQLVMDRTSKAVKLFNLEERKNAAGSVTEIDIFQWKNALLDNIKREKDYQEHCLDSSR